MKNMDLVIKALENANSASDIENVITMFKGIVDNMKTGYMDDDIDDRSDYMDDPDEAIDIQDLLDSIVEE